jgi:hypothetical protein
MKIKQSETLTIKRSQIKFADYNPRKQSKKVQEALKRNFKKVGYLGGIVWNKTTGNIVSGHKRIETMDIVYDYPQNDYDVKVEAVEMDDQTEKEQNIFMNSKDVQGEFDFNKLAELIPDINTDIAGISNETIELIRFEVPNFTFGKSDAISNEFKSLKNQGLSDDELKDRRRAKREERKAIANSKDDNKSERPYITITFDNFDNKVLFCETYSIDIYERYARGESVFTDMF